MAKGGSSPEQGKPEPWPHSWASKQIAEGPDLTLTVCHKRQLLMYWKGIRDAVLSTTSSLTSVNYHEEFFKNIIEDKERCY